MYTSSSPDLVTNAQPTFATVLYFQQRLCEYLVRDFTSANDMSDNPDAYYDGTGAALPDPLDVTFNWFRNQDYHYYSYKRGQSAGSFLRLATEMRALRGTFQASESGANSLVKHPLTISVCENGSAANLENENTDYDTFKYMTPGGGASPDVERFQAREVWRRLSVAATGARYIGWHTQQSLLADTENSAAPFKYLGLRHDDALVGADPSADQDANERLSYFAYQRLIGLAYIKEGLIQGTLVARLATALPTPTAADYFRTTSTTEIADLGIAIHFTLGRDKHAYLLMIDPTAETSVTAYATLTPVSGAPTHFEIWATIPRAIWYWYPGPERWEFPTSVPTEPWNVPMEVRHNQMTFDTAIIGADSDPILVHCTEPMTVIWTRVSA